MSQDDKDAAKAEPVSEGDREKRAATGESDTPAPNAHDPDAAERNARELDAIDACEQKPAWQTDPDAGLADASCGTIEEAAADAPAPSDAPASDAPATGDAPSADPAESAVAQVASGESRSVESVITAAVLPDYEPDGSDVPPAASQDAGQNTAQSADQNAGHDASDTPPPDSPSSPDDTAAAATETAVVSAPPRDLSEAVDRASKEEEAPAEGGRSMTLLGHLSELRVRLVRSLIALTVGFFACYGFAEELFNYLMLPLTRALPSGAKLIYTALPEAFFVYMQVALVAGAFLASPYLFYQIWAFIAPGLYDEEKRHIIPIACASALFFVAGAAFCYFQVFPYAFEFFVGFATDTIAPMPKLDEYLGFTLKMLLAFGLIFEMPLFAFFLSRLGLVTAQWMRKTRKYAILAIFIVAAILTPPDVFSQMMMAAPMLVLYEISIIVAAVFGKKKPGADSEDGEDSEEKDGEAAKPGPDTIVQGD